MSKILRRTIFHRYPVLTTWMLWHHLLRPGAHPLFRRTLIAELADRTTSRMVWIIPLAGFLACCGDWTLFSRPTSSITILLLVAMISFSSFYVVAWVMNIGVMITREYERGTYDPLCLTPPGAIGANWAICTACLHRDDALGWVNLMRQMMAGALLTILVLILMTTALKERTLDLSGLLGILADVAMLSIASYFDHVQSTVLGSLVGMLVPTYSHNSLNVRVLSGVMFLTLQAITFGSTLVSATVILPGIFGALNTISWFADSGSLFWSLLVFYLTREGIIVALWKALAYRLNANPAEFGFWP